jgi:hypothetical protein
MFRQHVRALSIPLHTQSSQRWPPRSEGGRKDDDEFKTPVFLTAENLQPFVSKDLIENSAPILSRGLHGQQTLGYRAARLPQVCSVLVAADASVLLVRIFAYDCLREVETRGIVLDIDGFKSHKPSLRLPMQLHVFFNLLYKVIKRLTYQDGVFHTTSPREKGSIAQ